MRQGFLAPESPGQAVITSRLHQPFPDAYRLLLQSSRHVLDLAIDLLLRGGERLRARHLLDGQLRAQLAVEEVARAESLAPSQEEIDREVENVARRLQQEPVRVREWLVQTGRYDSLTGTLRRQKALAHLVTLARGERT